MEQESNVIGNLEEKNILRAIKSSVGIAMQQRESLGIAHARVFTEKVEVLEEFEAKNECPLPMLGKIFRKAHWEEWNPSRR